MIHSVQKEASKGDVLGEQSLGGMLPAFISKCYVRQANNVEIMYCRMPE